jgi:aminoglycoside phosphotransferase (APT) family kinase protein
MNVKLRDRALEAARVVAGAHGLAHDEALVVSSGSNVLVHLRPAPVVARVMTATVALHADPKAWLEREVSVLKFLAPSGLAVAPSPLIEPGPHEHDGLWMTFTEWTADVEHRSRLDDAHRLGRALRSLHNELRGFDGDLGGRRAPFENIEFVHSELEPTDRVEAERVALLRARLDALDEVVFKPTLPAQAVHGDASLNNLFHTPQRLVWNDFEDTFRGPVHWDVAGFVISLRSRGASSSFVRRWLDAYGWGDEQELAPYIAANEIYEDIWQMYRLQRRRSDERQCQAMVSSELGRP